MIITLILVFLVILEAFVIILIISKKDNNGYKFYTDNHKVMLYEDGLFVSEVTLNPLYRYSNTELKHIKDTILKDRLDSKY